MFGRAAITLGIGPHSRFNVYFAPVPSMHVKSKTTLMNSLLHFHELTTHPRLGSRLLGVSASSPVCAMIPDLKAVSG